MIEDSSDDDEQKWMKERDALKRQILGSIKAAPPKKSVVDERAALKASIMS